jgi:hypothetical protein
MIGPTNLLLVIPHLFVVLVLVLWVDFSDFFLGNL